MGCQPSSESEGEKSPQRRLSPTEATDSGRRNTTKPTVDSGRRSSMSPISSPPASRRGSDAPLSMAKGGPSAAGATDATNGTVASDSTTLSSPLHLNRSGTLSSLSSGSLANQQHLQQSKLSPNGSRQFEVRHPNAKIDRQRQKQLLHSRDGGTGNIDLSARGKYQLQQQQQLLLSSPSDPPSSAASSGVFSPPVAFMMARAQQHQHHRHHQQHRQPPNDPMAPAPAEAQSLQLSLSAAPSATALAARYHEHLSKAEAAAADGRLSASKRRRKRMALRAVGPVPSTGSQRSGTSSNDDDDNRNTRPPSANSSDISESARRGKVQRSFRERSILQPDEMDLSASASLTDDDYAKQVDHVRKARKGRKRKSVLASSADDERDLKSYTDRLRKLGLEEEQVFDILPVAVLSSPIQQQARSALKRASATNSAQQSGCNSPVNLSFSADPHSTDDGTDEENSFGSANSFSQRERKSVKFCDDN